MSHVCSWNGGSLDPLEGQWCWAGVAGKAGCVLVGFICLLLGTEFGRKWFSEALGSLVLGTVSQAPGQGLQLRVLLLETFLSI